jgi:pimeloyl-ACP methyl ester carboxylesterase
VEGQGSPAIVFIHGLGEYLESWKNQTQYFSKNFKTIALDLRGHGKSSVPKKKIEISDFASDVKGLLDHLGVKKANLCGLSMGGLVVLEFYKRNPEYCSTLILVASRHQFPPAQTGALEGMSMEIIGEEVATFALAANAPDPLKQEVAKMVAATNKNAYLQSAEATSLLDYTDVLSSVKVSTLIIVGDMDIVTPVSSAETIQNLVPESVLKIMKGVGHLPNRERPDEFNATVEQFLKNNTGK